MKISTSLLRSPRSSPDRALTRPQGGFVRSLASAVLFAGLSAASLLHATALSPLTTKHEFDASDGHSPSFLMRASDGNFYGSSLAGGVNNRGVVYKMTPAGTVTVLHSFDGSDGYQPFSVLVEGNDGHLYGEVKNRFQDYGGIFRITKAGGFTDLVTFDSSGGKLPTYGLVKGADGNFYGTTFTGGSDDKGTIFKMTPSGTVTTLVQFNGTNGEKPSTKMVLAADGDFYGTTQLGGTSNVGTVFKVTSSGTLTTLTSFSRSTTGGYPVFGFLQASDGNFYGTAKGETDTDAEVFKVTPAGTLTVVASWGSSVGNGVSGLLQGPDGNFYLVCSTEGANHFGSVVKVTASGTVSTLVDFNGQSSPLGASPVGNLILGANNELLGTTQVGGTSNAGTIFSIDAGFTPEIAVEAPVGTDLTSGVSTVDLGTTYTGLASITTFTIKNTGSAALTVSGADVTGGNSADFAVNTGSLSSSVAVGGQTTFTVTLTPSSTGTRSTTLRITSNDTNESTFSLDLTSTAVATAPEIAVEAPAGSDLTSGSATVDFGTSYNGFPTAKTFTIKNTGNAALNLSSVSVIGGNSADFVVSTAAMASSIEGGSETTFTVTLTPAVTGTRSTTLRILNNDPNEATFSLALTSSTLLAQPIYFSAPVYAVGQGATSIKVTVQRTIATAAQAVTINTDNGTASAWPPFAAAVATGVSASSDYTDLAGAITTVSFPVGIKSKIITIPLIAKTGTVPNKRFTATISDPTNGAILGTVTSSTIQILATDLVKPTLTVTYPSVSDTSFDAVTYPTINVVGNASDLRGIAQVLVSVNGGTATAATVGEVAGTTVPFTFTATPRLGANSIVISSTDLRGNKTTVTRNFTMTGGVQLTMLRAVPTAQITKPDLVGNLALVVTPSQNATAITPTTANSNPKTCNVLPGAPVRLTATPASGYVFSSWSGLPTGAVALGNVVTFTMPSIPTSITATFVANVFAAPTNMGTTFYGLLHPGDGVASSYQTEGYFTGTLVSPTGSFTGQLSIDGITQAIAATFYGNGSATFKVGTAIQNSLSVAGHTLTMNYDTTGKNEIAVTLTGESGACSGTAERGYYSATRKVGASYLNAGTSGYFTFMIPAKVQLDALNQPVDTHSYPQGFGFGFITLSDVGVITISGTLADGTAFTGASGLITSNTSPLYAQLITPGTSTKSGVLTGELVINTAAADTDIQGINLRWIRPASSAALYTNGWPTGISVDLMGAHYTKTNTAQTTLGIGAVNPTVGNADLQFFDGKLTSDITYTAFNIAGNTVSQFSTTSSGFSLAIGSNGTFSGSFTPNWASPSLTKPTFKGIMLQKGANTNGFGFFQSNATGDTHPEIGGMTLSGR